MTKIPKYTHKILQLLGYISPMGSNFTREKNLQSNRLLLPEIIFPRYDEDTDALFLTDQGGFMWTHEEWEDLKKVVDQCYNNTPVEEVAEINEILEVHHFDSKNCGCGEHRKENRLTISTIAPKIKKSPGIVYVLKAENGIFKIGQSKNMNERKRWFDLHLPFKVELLHVIKTEQRHALERELHEYFAEKRVNGEWFQLDEEDIAKLLYM